MPMIEMQPRVVYVSPSRGRAYLTARGAANAEANRMLARKYPTEKPAYENGFCFDPGYHWTEDERLRRVHERLVRLILRKLKSAPTTKDTGGEG
ncbi:hypothetical protein [Ralstonia sp. Ralssp135]|uniref:hypothetical protein n=1 Tax=Ralstonia sp. Ralssp135 TaxID=3243016 RepID=UPI0039AF9BA9